VRLTEVTAGDGDAGEASSAHFVWYAARPRTCLAGGCERDWLVVRSAEFPYAASYVLGGIITEHPDYMNNEFSVERVIAGRADLISASGRVIE
jgi:hypothetical protein